MTRIPSWLLLIIPGVLVVLGGAAISAQDKYTLHVPGGLAFSEFRGYEGWPVIAISENEGKIAVIVGNPVMIDAYKEGVPGNLLNVDFIVKDSKRFADSGGWGYGVFDYNAASDTFTPGTTAGTPPQGNDAKCGFACHTRAKTRDYVFTEYGKR